MGRRECDGLEWKKESGQIGLVRLNGTLNAHRYVAELIQLEVVPYGRDLWLTFQQDNIHQHSDRQTNYFMRANAVFTVPWPAYLPDLSPIEHMGDPIDLQIWSHDPPAPVVDLPDNAGGVGWHPTGKHCLCHGDANQCMRLEGVTPFKSSCT